MPQPGYLPALASELETFENVVFNWLPSEFTTAMMATEMPAAMRPYSIAVAPDSSLAKRLRMVFIDLLLEWSTWLYELDLIVFVLFQTISTMPQINRHLLRCG